MIISNYFLKLGTFIDSILSDLQTKLIMKKILLALAVVALITGTLPALAQNAREATVKFMKGQQNAIVADYDLPEKVVADALKERLEKEGLTKRSSEKGFMAYKGATWANISPDKMDIYARVEGKGDKSTITMLASKGYDNFISTTTDADKVQKIQAFLNNFIKDARAYQLKLAIQAQEEVVKKIDKEYKNSTEDGEKLLREKEKIEKQIAENKTEQSKKETIVTTEKAKLEELKRQM
jgi:hypothetical protein